MGTDFHSTTLQGQWASEAGRRALRDVLGITSLQVASEEEPSDPALDPMAIDVADAGDK
jgi:hypothetical protein